MGASSTPCPRFDKLRAVTEAALREMLGIIGSDDEPTLDDWNCAAHMLEAGLRIHAADVLDRQLGCLGELMRELIFEIQSK